MYRWPQGEADEVYSKTQGPGCGAFQNQMPLEVYSKTECVWRTYMPTISRVFWHLPKNQFHGTVVLPLNRPVEQLIVFESWELNPNKLRAVTAGSPEPAVTARNGSAELAVKIESLLRHGRFGRTGRDGTQFVGI